MHETGHALGLKHGHPEPDVTPSLPSEHDSYEYSVMTYSQYVGDPPKGGDDAPDHPTTFMQDDIAALQYMYGAHFTSDNDNTSYQWNPDTGELSINGNRQGNQPWENYIFSTIWDGGGAHDTYDFSNYTTSLKVDLNPGAWFTVSASQLAKLNSGGSQKAAGNIANALLYKDPRTNNDDLHSLIENVIGGTGNDHIKGNIADNYLDGGLGDDILTGSAGDDTYIIDSTGDQVIEQANEGIDIVQAAVTYTLSDNVENLNRMLMTYHFLTPISMVQATVSTTRYRETRAAISLMGEAAMTVSMAAPVIYTYVIDSTVIEYSKIRTKVSTRSSPA